jgi:hypothetical protein
MKATELRLGNLINIGGNTLDTYQTYKPTKVTLAILNEIAGENEERPDAVLSVFQPIPLTEEWLLKVGLLKDGYDFCMEREKYKQDSSCNFFVRRKKKYFMPCTHGVGYCNLCMLKAIKYVHQLQNICFALTGNELTIQK